MILRHTSSIFIGVQMKLLFASILLASSLASTTVSASQIQVIHSNDKPSRCELREGEKVVATCNSFKLLKQNKVYWFTYYFNKSPVSFVAVPLTEEKDIAAFIVRKLYYDNKLHNLEKSGVCTMSKQLNFNTCLVNNFEINYIP